MTPVPIQPTRVLPAPNSSAMSRSNVNCQQGLNTPPRAAPGCPKSSSSLEGDRPGAVESSLRPSIIASRAGSRRPGSGDPFRPRGTPAPGTIPKDSMRNSLISTYLGRRPVADIAPGFLAYLANLETVAAVAPEVARSIV